jgi:hypothetical protein
MERPTPDLTGYREAQVALVAQLGSDVPFFTPSAVTWPAEAILDPETGEPYDPTVVPTSSGFTSASVRCGIAVRPIGLSRRGVADDEGWTALGKFEDGEGVLLVPIADFEDNDLDEATEAEIYNERYEVTQTDEDGLGDENHRMLVYVRQKGLEPRDP